MVEVLIIRAPGTNCEEETMATFEQAGSRARIVPFYNILKDPASIHNFHILVFPGGFSYGDYLGSGTVLALKLHKIRKYIISFLEQKKIILGICNGFQILVKAGLLPDWTKNNDLFLQKTKKQIFDVTLTFNKSGKFETRWVKLKIISKKYDYIKDMQKEYISLPVAHGEGRFVAVDKKTIQNLYENGQVLFEYAGANYPDNPNGSINNIAGICCPYGQVIGLMPHPERFHNIYLYPHWQEIIRNKKQRLVSDGLLFIRSIVKYVSKRFGKNE